MMRSRLKHLPIKAWPPKDVALFDAAFADGDIFDEKRGAGAHLRAGSRKAILFGWRRWLGFLAEHHPADLGVPAADRITPERVRDYVDHLATSMSKASVGTMVARLYDAARIVAPEREWGWLKAVKTRLLALATPADRFHRLIPPHLTLDLGFALMDAANSIAVSGHKLGHTQFRDGLIIAMLSLWPIRRRSLTSLTADHVEVADGRAEILLGAGDTKTKRSESWRVPEPLRPYLIRYLQEVRPVLLGRHTHAALWVGQRGNPLGDGAIYEAVCRRTEVAFGKPMALHDFRRAGATFLAMDAPELVGLIPGVLQHASLDTADRHYNLARSSAASRRYSATIAELRAKLRHRRQP